jgi:Ni,Fe-hydrogenase maturation factor
LPRLTTAACYAAKRGIAVVAAALGYYPSWPESIQSLKILDLKVGSSSVDLELRRYEKVVIVDILRPEGELEIVTIK